MRTPVEQRAFVSNHMNTKPQTPIGDLSGRETELGVPTTEMVEQRAREIARLDERNPHEFTDTDWEQARAELTGTRPRRSHDDSTWSERDSIPGESGREIPRVAPKDEALIDERLASRGVEEAAHDQMVEAAKSDQEQEG
jgi:hypothetical protein